MSISDASLIKILDDLRNLPREVTTVEFKLNFDSSKDIGEYLSALANSAVLEGHDRAWMVWGVENNTHIIKGTSFDPFSAKGEGNQSLVMWITQLTSPRPDFEFHELKHPHGRIIMLEIYPPRTAPLAFKNTRYIRIDSHKSSLFEHSDKESRLWEILAGTEDWSGVVIPEATLNDLDLEAIGFAREKFIEYLIKNELDTIRHEKIRTDAMAWDITTLLNKARLTKQGRITRSTLLLLGRDESAHFLSPADLKISWILRDEKNCPIGNQHFGMPFLLSSEILFKRIRNIPIDYMPDGTLFPTPVPPYDSWVIREALHNCIAHQDYRLGGKINVVEYPDKLIFTNLGAFIPPSVEWMLDHQSPPEHYRNQWLIDGMVRLRMIDQIGSGIRRMFETQRERFFPLPDYIIDQHLQSKPRVEVHITGTILDIKYTKTLMQHNDLSLRQVLLLDRVQKQKKISAVDARHLKEKKLIEGRSPNYFISAKIAERTAQKAGYIHNRALDDDYYQRLIIEYLQQYKRASRQELNDLLLPKLSDALSLDQKQNKVRNLIQSLRREGVIRNVGYRGVPVWIIGDEEGFAKQEPEDEI